MGKKVIYNFDAEYASMTELQDIPKGYINKKVCGCGLTSLAIEKEKCNTVIAVPTTTLVNSKVKQYPNIRCGYKLLGVDGNTSDYEISEYVYSCYNYKQPFKIMVTYDSISRVEHLLNDAHLVIDESDCLLKYAKMKAISKGNRNKDVINYLLDLSEEYKDTVSFISATPVPIEYFNKQWMYELDDVEMNWKNTVKSKPYLLNRKNVKKALIEEIINPILTKGKVTIGNNTFSKVIIFFNTVKGIKDIIKKVNLNQLDCGIICGNSVRNDFILSDGNKLERIEDFDNLPTFTFVTSTGYNGCDIYDKEAMNVIISDISADWQITDIQTELKQAISRQRIKSNPNYDRYIFIYNNIPDNEELKDKVDSIKCKMNNLIKALNTNKGNDYFNDLCEVVSANTEFNTYVNLNEDAVYEFNDMAINSDLYFIQETIVRYKEGDLLMDIDNVIKKPTYNTTLSYTALYKKYQEHLNGTYTFDIDELESENYILIDSYYQKFGKLEKDSSYAKKRLNTQGLDSVQLVASKYFCKGIRYSNKEVKSKLQSAYDDLGLNRKAKATDAFEIFKDKVKPVKNNGERFIEFI